MSSTARLSPFPCSSWCWDWYLGRGALGVIVIGPHSLALDGLATISLALVLFLDAVALEVEELRREWRVPFLALGPVTALTLLGVAAAAHLLLALSWVQALLLGAALASTDPVVVRDVVRDEGIPRSVRRTLTIEAALNDLVVLPVVLILIAVRQATLHGAFDWLRFLASLLLLSPVVGMGVGGVGAWLMGRADARFSIRREYQAMYGLGLVLAAYAVAQIVGGDGFLAAFFAGLAVNVFDVTLWLARKSAGATRTTRFLLHIPICAPHGGAVGVWRANVRWHQSPPSFSWH